MKNTFYRILEESDRLDGTELIWMDTEEWKVVSEIHVGKTVGSSTVALRPVSIERVTGTESAFPAFDGSGAVGGLTVREWYSGLAMQGFLSIPDNRTWKGGDQNGPVEEWQRKLMAMDAELCVKMADALIAALNKKEEAA